MQLIMPIELRYNHIHLTNNQFLNNKNQKANDYNN